MRWVRRNEDKPHRCPECHTIPDRCRALVLGPRTAVSCARCGVKWRMGVRYTRRTEQWLYRRSQRTAWRWLTITRHLADRENERHAA
jgi:hypothetical protein